MSSTASHSSQALYVYAFTWPGQPVPAGPGMDENQRIQIHTHSGIAALVAEVDVRDFTGDLGERHLQDIAWLGPRACRHAAVLDQAMATGPVFPLPFGTLFSGWSALEQAIEQRSAEITNTLRQVADCQEWSVEGTLNRKQAVDFLLAEGLRSGLHRLPEASGRRHLEEQKLRRTLAAQLEDWLDPRIIEIHRDLITFCRDSRPRRLLNDRVFHWAFLVPVNQIEAFRQTLDVITDSQASTGLNLRLTGPWPAYSFCKTAP